jgi:hypothetical protein
MKADAQMKALLRRKITWARLRRAFLRKTAWYRLLDLLLAHLMPSRLNGIADKLRCMMASPPWCMDDFSWDGQTLTLWGWAIQPGEKKALFCINGVPFDTVRYPLERDDIQRIFWFVPNARLSGFELRAKSSTSKIFSNGYAAITYCEDEHKTPFSENQTIYIFDPAKDEFPVPDSVRRGRVQGNGSRGSFLLEGYSTFRKISAAVERFAGRHLNSFSSILDWGCGCGRILRYFNLSDKSRIVGIDIDHDNVQWCRNNFSHSTFQYISSNPPTGLPRLPSTSL